MSIKASLFSLAKYDNGFFKSEKQRDFILSQCDSGGVYIVQDSVYNNPVRWFIQCDPQGIVSIVKETRKASATTFERATGKDADIAVKRGTEMRAINAYKKALAAKANKALEIYNKYNTDYICNLMTEKKLESDVLISIIKKRDKLGEFGMKTLSELDKIGN